jgi:hypothetical protein
MTVDRDRLKWADAPPRRSAAAFEKLAPREREDGDSLKQTSSPPVW